MAGTFEAVIGAEAGSRTATLGGEDAVDFKLDKLLMALPKRLFYFENPLNFFWDGCFIKYYSVLTGIGAEKFGLFKADWWFVMRIALNMYPVELVVE